MRRFVIWNKLQCEYGSCSWAVHDDHILTVVTAHGSKSTQLGNSHPDGLARLLMSELAVEQQDVA